MEPLVPGKRPKVGSCLEGGFSGKEQVVLGQGQCYLKPWHIHNKGCCAVVLPGTSYRNCITWSFSFWGAWWLSLTEVVLQTPCCIAPAYTEIKQPLAICRVPKCIQWQRFSCRPVVMCENSLCMKWEYIWVIFFTKLYLNGQKENVKMHF